MIELKNLSKVYKTSEKEIVALDGINLTIQDGEIFGIIGLSGAGKSTLVPHKPPRTPGPAAR